MDNLKILIADQQSAYMVRQAIKDDQALYAEAHGIGVTVKDGIITLDGEVSTVKLMNLAINTAAAIATEDKVKNHIAIKPSDELSRADDDGFAIKKSHQE